MMGVLTSLISYSQKIITINGALPEDKPIPQMPIDSARYKVVYSMSYLTDVDNVDERKSGKTGLFIGKDRSVFLDMTEVENDSLLAETRWKGEHSFTVMDEMMKISKDKVFDPVVVLNYPEKGCALYQAYVSGEKRYIDDGIDMNWIIKDDTKDILGYQCRKAELNYRGRDYEAWYSEDLPISYGPYLFHGLPGLIFEINDVENEYRFNIIGFEKIGEPFLLTIDDYNVESISRNDFRKLERNKYENPMESMSMGVKDLKITDSFGNEVKQISSRRYNPIEKE